VAGIFCWAQKQGAQANRIHNGNKELRFFIRISFISDHHIESRFPGKDFFEGGIIREKSEN
jgi:hypothetical protein